MATNTLVENGQRRELAIRVMQAGVAGCYIGHGAFGIITKAGWLPYLAVGGIHGDLAWKLMPWIGAWDIAIGILALIWPCRAVLVWAALWATWTALCRPLAGEAIWEFVERAGNYGVPLVLFLAVGWRGKWVASCWSSPRPTDERTWIGVRWVLRATTMALLIGHAGCTLTEPGRASFPHNCAVIWPQAPATYVQLAAVFEAVLGLAIGIRPLRTLLVAACIWKLATEGLYLVAHAPVWEVVERFGSYTAPVALAILLPRVADRPVTLPSAQGA